MPRSRPVGSRSLTSIRLPESLLDRADALVPVLAGDPSVTAVGSITRAAVLHLSMVEGLDVLERRYKKGDHHPR